jgi:hypothetical protein
MPEASITDQLAVLRRPQTAEEGHLSERISRHPRLFPVGGDRLFVDATRLVTASDGTELVVTAAQSVPDISATSPSYDTCAALRRKRLERMLTGKPRKLRRRARALDTKLTRHGRLSPTPPTAIGLSRRSSEHREAGSPIDAARLQRDGIWGMDETARPRQLFGLVPDGIAIVEIHNGRERARTRARENVFSARIPAGAKRWVPDRIIWKDADGTTANVIKPAVIYADFARP